MAEEWEPVGRVLLASWPSQVASWGREIMGAYLNELRERGVTPEQAIIALRSSDERFPPAVGEIAAAARVDPSTPTFEEAWAIIYRRLSKGGTAKAILEDLGQHHPSVRAFVDRQGVERLRVLRVDDPDHGELRLKEMRAAWDRFRESSEDREIAAIAAGAPIGHLRRLDPLSVLDKRALALVAGENPKGEKQ